MRDGFNPSKQNMDLPAFPRHRVIVPVYIPNSDGYFKDAIEILRLCLDSLRLATAGKANVTLIANDSTEEVVEELNRRYEEGWIDQLLVNRRNWGRVDTMISAARMAFEELVTVTDSDVLFKPGWIEAVEGIFHAFPECGFASTTPNPTFTYYCTSATILGAAVRRELHFEKVVPEEDLDRFAHSIRRPDLFSSEHRRSQMIVRRAGTTACVGSGHFVCTIRKEVLDGVPHEPSLKAYQGGAEQVWKDRPPDRMGYWRLATPRAYTYHMGNVPEPWMHEELERYRGMNNEIASRPATLPRARRTWAAHIPWRLRNGLMSRISKASFKTGNAARPAIKNA